MLHDFGGGQCWPGALAMILLYFFSLVRYYSVHTYSLSYVFTCAHFFGNFYYNCAHTVVTHDNFNCYINYGHYNALLIFSFYTFVRKGQYFST